MPPGQPLLACFRADNPSLSRPSFLSAHRALGLLASILAPSLTKDGTVTLPPQPQSPLATTPGSETVAPLTETVKQLLSGSVAIHKMVAALVVSHWGQCPQDVLALLNTALTEHRAYDELTPFVVTLQKDCHVS